MSSKVSEQLVADFASVSLGSTAETELLPYGSSVPGRQRYLFYFLHRHLNFRIAEAESIAYMVTGAKVCSDGKPPIVWERPHGDELASPYWFAHLQSEDVAQAIVKHSMLLKFLIKPIAEADSLQELQAALADLPQSFRDTYGGEDQSFKFVLEGYGRSISDSEKRQLINSFQPSTQFKGKINLVAPMNKWWVILVDDPKPSAIMPRLPVRYYFGLEIGVAESRNNLAIYDLKKRKYIGPTSMDPELAFIMCNMGCVKHHSLVLDPNVGTGSMLIAAAAKGAFTLGFDIDIRVVKIGKVDKQGEKLNLWTNFAQYNLPPPLGLWRGDAHKPAFRTGLEEVLHTILCDPPYGVRAGGRKSNSVPDMTIRDRTEHITSTAPYTLAECLRDLVDMAARLLVVGGRLVFWIPVAEEAYNEDELPTHPAMELVANSEQILSTRYGRRLITMSKTKRYNADEAQEHFEKLGPPVMAQDLLHRLVYAVKPEAAETSIGKKLPPRMRCKNI